MNAVPTQSIPAITNTNMEIVDAVPIRSIPAITYDNMEIVDAVPIQSYSPQLNGSEVDASGQQHAKSCHQCRKKRGFVATCKNQGNEKPCVMKFCNGCLKRGYGEMIEDVYFLNDWVCPRCRGICHCSACMRNIGQQPIGPLYRLAKASGFNSVSEMISKKASEDLKSNNAVVLYIKEDNLDKELVVDQSAQTEKGNYQGGSKGVNGYPKKTKKVRRVELSEECNSNNVKWKRNAKDKLKTKVEETHSHMDGPEAWGANDYFFDPSAFASYNFLSNPFIFDFKATRQIHGSGSSLSKLFPSLSNRKKNDGNTSIGDSDKDIVNSDMDIDQLQQVGKCVLNPDAKIIKEEIPLPL